MSNHAEPAADAAAHGESGPESNDAALSIKLLPHQQKLMDQLKLLGDHVTYIQMASKFKPAQMPSVPHIVVDSCAQLDVEHSFTTRRLLSADVAAVPMRAGKSSVMSKVMPHSLLISRGMKNGASTRGLNNWSSYTLAPKRSLMYYHVQSALMNWR